MGSGEGERERSGAQEEEKGRWERGGHKQAPDQSSGRKLAIKTSAMADVVWRERSSLASDEGLARGRPEC